MSASPGTRLKAARLARELSVEDITAATKMRPNIIRALEADDYTQFPSITHARNFLSLYGKHLKVDVKDGLNRLATPAKIGIENYQYLNVERSDESSQRPQRRMRIHSAPRSSDQTSRTLGIIALVIGFGIIALYLSINLRRLNLASGTPKSDAPAETNPTPSPSDSTLKPAPKSSKSAPAPEPTSAPFYTPTQGNRRLIKPPAPPPFD